MCFSTGASFGSSLVLGAVGVIAVSIIKMPFQVPFAVIPLMFAIQQVAEGMGWIGLSLPGYTSWSHVPVAGFLVFTRLYKKKAYVPVQ